MLFQTKSTDNGCQNKGTMLIKSSQSFYLLLLSRTGLMIFGLVSTTRLDIFVNALQL